MKAITPVIALVMLMLITVSIVGISYTWFSGLFSSQTKKTISIPPGGAYCSNGEIKVFVLNNGDSAITSSDIKIAQVDGVDMLNTPFFGDMKSYLKGSWKFDEAAGAVASDSSGNGNNANLVNSPEWKKGKFGNALKFISADNDYVQTISNPITSDDMTLSVWVYPEIIADGSFHAIAGYQGAGVNYRPFNIWVNPSAGLHWWISKSDNTQAWSGTIDNFFDAPNKWYSIVFTKTGNRLAVYKNGQKNSLADSPFTDLYKPPFYWIGRIDNYFTGYIDEVKIYGTGTGDVNIQPGSSGVIMNYPGIDGKHSLKIATSLSAVEAVVNC